MNRFLLNILLALAWMFLNGNLYFENFVEGFVIGFIILWISSFSSNDFDYIKKVPKFFGFVFYFLKELIIANLKVAYDILTPQHLMNPSIIAVPLSVKTDFEINILANLITLTPGTLSLDISSDKKFIFIHSMYITDPEEFRNDIKNGFEKRLLELTN